MLLSDTVTFQIQARDSAEGLTILIVGTIKDSVTGAVMDLIYVDSHIGDVTLSLTDDRFVSANKIYAQLYYVKTDPVSGDIAAELIEYEYDTLASNHAPVAVIQPSFVDFTHVKFSAAGSYDPDGDMLGDNIFWWSGHSSRIKYIWNFGDGAVPNRPLAVFQRRPIVSYSTPGVKTVTLTVFDEYSVERYLATGHFGSGSVTTTVNAVQYCHSSFGCANIIQQGDFCTSDTECNDGLFCNGIETCDSSTGSCLSGVSSIADDGVACTVDICDEVTDSIINVPDDSICNDGSFCTGIDICDATLGCQSAGDPCLLFDSFCSELFESCGNCLTDADCNFDPGLSNCIDNICL